jgi:hypothetical protein
MPVNFLTETQKERYGQFVDELSAVELARYFHLDDKDRSLIDKRRGDHNRLGFALQLGTVRCLGTFLSNPIDMPSGAIDIVANQINVTKLDSLPLYMERKQTRHAHRLEIQREYAYCDLNDPPWRFRLSRMLYARAWTSTERPSLLFDVATDWLIANKVLLPGATTLERLVSQIRERSSLRLWRELACLPDRVQKIVLHELLSIENDSRISALEQFRQGPVHVSGPSFSKALDRYQELHNLGIHTLDISGIPPVRLKNLARHTAQISAYKIARMPEDRRLASLVAFAHAFETIALDDALDVLDLLITDIAGEAKKLGKKNRLRTLKDLDHAAIALAEACALLLDENHPVDDLRDEIFAQVPRTQITRAIETINNLARPPEDNFHDEMVAQYGRLRQPLSRLLDGIDFKAAPAGTSVVKALDFLRTVEGTKKQTLKDAPLGVVTKAWRRLVFDKDGQVNRRGYTLCVMDQLQDALRRRDVYVAAMSMSPPVTVGAIPAPNFCKAWNGRPTEFRSAVPSVIRQTRMKPWKVSRSSSMLPIGKQPNAWARMTPCASNIKTASPH